MAIPFWHLGHLSDVQLLQCLQRVLHTKQRALAELIAHLGEVEERRLHLQAACSSRFHHCVHLGMSEDEACRRIEVARLARRFPALFAELASGGLTLSVALLLKRQLSAENHLELIGALRGASTERARELLAARFPSPDVPSGMHELPERRNPASQPASFTPPAQGAPSVAMPLKQPLLSSQPSQATPPTAASSTAASPACGLLSDELLSEALPSNELHSREAAQPTAPPSATARQPERSRWQQRIEPLSARRYRVQFTADARLKRKLEQARDLLRHAPARRQPERHRLAGAPTAAHTSSGPSASAPRRHDDTARIRSTRAARMTTRGTVLCRSARSRSVALGQRRAAGQSCHCVESRLAPPCSVRCAVQVCRARSASVEGRGAGSAPYRSARPSW